MSTKKTTQVASKRKISPARQMALKLLQRVEDGAFASVLLASETETLRPDDRALCYELVLGTLRWQLWLDKAIEHYAARAITTLDEAVRHALRLGLYQLRFLTRIPVSAAVNEAVNSMYQARLSSAAAFVNAVLRRAAREPEYDPAAGVADRAERLSIATSHPAWMIERWIKAFGLSEAESFARANNQTPSVAFRINAGAIEADSIRRLLGSAGIEVEPSVIAPGAWRVRKGSWRDLRPFITAGAVYVQDEASQLVAHVLDAKPGDRVLDVCAAPGSKTTHIAGLARDKALVIAGDLVASRLHVLREAIERQKLKSVRVVQLDAEQVLPFADRSFDRVLVDAPCSGTGTLRHNPEIRWRITASDIGKLAVRQHQILAGAARMLRPGGRLVYSTCSVEKEENEGVAAAFCDQHKEFRPVFAAAVPERLRSSSLGEWRTWPHHHQADGFYGIALERCQ